MRVSGPKVTRMSGAGNTFFFHNGWDKAFSGDRRAFARRLCQEIVGLHADGFVFIEKHASADFAWDFYNEDGSPAEMCGNAARCAIQFFQCEIEKKEKLAFSSVVGIVEGEVLSPGWVKVKLPPLKEGGRFVTVPSMKKEFYFINTGVPHLLVEDEPDAELARTLRSAPQFAPTGTNVTFMAEDSPGEIRAVTFERGVEDFTLACGTGAVAAAAFGRERNPFLKNFLVEMPGGELSVEWDDERQAILTGPAKFEFDLVLEGEKTCQNGKA